jgi:hypothetical protein
MVIETVTQDGSNEGAGTEARGTEGLGIDSGLRFITDTIDNAVDQVSKVLEGENTQKVVSGAAVGALAAIVLPFSIGVGALLGAGYVAFRNRS